MNDILSEANTLRGVYQDLEAYQRLCEEDRRFFDNLFILLLFNESKIYSNKYLSQRFNIPVSTIEKRVRRLDRANLIKRKVENELKDNEKWITTARTIELDPVTFAFMRAKNEEARIQAARMEALEKNNVFISKTEIEQLQQEAKIVNEGPAPEPPTEDAISEFKRMLENL